MTRKLTTEEYMSYMDKTPVACIDIVLFNEDRTQVLLFKRTNEPAQGIYYTPGGCIQKGETFAEAAVRKMEQELGITLDAGKLNNPQVIEELWPSPSFLAIPSPNERQPPSPLTLNTTHVSGSL